MGSIIQKVSLTSVRFFSPIGFYEEERVLGNGFLVDVSVSFPFLSADSEDLSNTVNYEEIYSLMCAVMKKERKLLESAAEEILLGIRAKYGFVCEVNVSICKATPPFGHGDMYASVSLHYQTDTSV